MILRLWAAFKRWLLSDSPNTSHNFGNPDLYLIDTPKLLKELRVEEEAEKLGRRELPATDSSDLTGTEAKILQVIEKARQEYLDWGADRLKMLNQQITAVDVGPAVSRVRELVSEFERKASDRIDAWAAELAQLARAVEHREQDFNDFVLRNGLGRPPKYPTDAAKLVRYALLGAFVVFEGAANSFFFAQGLWGGLVGGFIYAAIFAFMNILIAYVAGVHLLPLRNHAHPVRKLFGWLGVPLTLVAIVLMAFVIGHFRDASTSGNVDNAAQLALIELKQAPFQLKDIYSWLLAGISVLFAGSALIAAYSMDDPYPGYGKVHRDLLEAKAEWDEELQGVRDELSAMKDEAVEDLDKLLDRLQLDLRKLDEDIAQKQRVEQRLTTAFADVDLCLRALISQFRTCNQLHRNTKSPSYFSATPTAKPLVLPDFSVAGDRRRHKDQERIAREVQAEVPNMRAAIQAAFSKQFDRLVPIEQQLRGHGA